MTDQQHPITPPPELVEQLRKEAPLAGVARERHLIAAAYRAGADYELNAILALAKNQVIPMKTATSDEDCYFDGFTVAGIRRKRRPVPPNLAEEALATLDSMQIKPLVINGVDMNTDVRGKYSTIRRALERLQELEGQADG